MITIHRYSLIFILFIISGCQFFAGQSPNSAIETGVAQTLEVGGYLTEIAAGGGPINTVTPAAAIQEEAIASSPVASAVSEIIATQTLAASNECPSIAGQVPFDQLNFPAELGEISEQNGQLFFNDSEVLASFQSDADCNQVIWLSSANSPEWPIFIKGSNGAWALGASAWNGKLKVVNASEFPVSLSLEPLVADQLPSGEAQEFPLTGYEIFDMSFLPPGKYNLSFSYQSDQLITGSCIIDFGQTSVFLFTITSIGVAVFEESFTPSHSDDINILSSQMCGT